MVIRAFCDLCGTGNAVTNKRLELGDGICINISCWAVWAGGDCGRCSDCINHEYKEKMGWTWRCSRTRTFNDICLDCIIKQLQKHKLIKN